MELEDRQREYIALYLINKFIPTKTLTFLWKTYDNDIYFYETETGTIRVLDNTRYELSYNRGSGALHHGYELVNFSFLIFKRGFCWDKNCPSFIKGTTEDIKQWHTFNLKLL